MTFCYPIESGKYQLSSGYGQRAGGFHAGTDFSAPLGTPIYAVSDGVVVEGKDRRPGSVDGFANWVWLDSQKECGKDFIYGHMRHADILVTAGQRVKAGQMIARVGNEGQSTGPHLHFEVWTPPGRIGGQHSNPIDWLVRAKAINPVRVNTPKPVDPKPPVTTPGDKPMTPQEKAARIMHEMTYQFTSRVKNSTFKDTLVGFLLQSDKAAYKVEKRLDEVEQAVNEILEALQAPKNK